LAPDAHRRDDREGEIQGLLVNVWVRRWGRVTVSTDNKERAMSTPPGWYPDPSSPTQLRGAHG